jgi:polyhydroxybutyrate depolymerase
VPAGKAKPALARLAVLIAAGWATGAAADALGPGDHDRTLPHDGRTRRYTIHVPVSYEGALPAPLVLDFHGLVSNKTEQAERSGFRELSDAQGFLVVYPQGLYGKGPDKEDANPLKGPSWNGGDYCCGQAQANGEDDVGFAIALVGAVAAEVNVDLDRVYATGLSNGGSLTQRLGCEAADVFAGIAPVSFPMPFSPLEECQPDRPLPVIAFHGLTDELVPYAGGGFLGFPSARESFLRWAALDGCAGAAPDETTTVGEATCETFTSCAEGAEVSLCSVVADEDESGHVLYLDEDLDVAATAWSFLSRFERVTLPEPAPALQALAASVVLSLLAARRRRRA